MVRCLVFAHCRGALRNFKDLAAFPAHLWRFTLVALGRSVPLRAQFFFMLPDGAFGLLATVFRTCAPVTASGSQCAGLAPALRATACFYPVLPAWPFARPVSRLCSWPGHPHGGDGLASAPLCGLSPAGISWLYVTISPKFA